MNTNVSISSLFGGNPRKVFDLWKFGEITLCLSKLIVDEYVEVLRRLELHDEKELEELLGLLHMSFISFTRQKLRNCTLWKKTLTIISSLNVR